jgi:hypothetical protein
LSAAALQGVCPEPVLASVRFSYETAQGQAEASAPHLEEEPLHAGNLGAGLRRQELPRLLCEVEEDGACEKPPFFEPPFHIQTTNRSIYLDRLGTNMGKADPQGRSFSAAPDSKTVCGKTGFFGVLSLCLSRVCLGKIIIYRYKWLKKPVCLPVAHHPPCRSQQLLGSSSWG